MIPLEQAHRHVIDAAQPLTAVDLPLAEALGCRLAVAVTSDVDSPPFDKSLMDGFAVRSQDIERGGVTLQVIERVTAGEVPQQDLSAGQATKIMTGGPLPKGADAVVILEQTQSTDDQVTIDQHPVRPEQNLLRRGTCMQAGETILDAGTKLSPGQIGLLAEVGCDPVRVIPRPTVAILSTGNELVPPGESISGGMIRNSNGPMLSALAEASSAISRPLGIVGDDQVALNAAVAEGLQSDILVLSGGVSAGVLDLVPQALAHNGVEEVFHKVRLKPGKPIWFGKRVTANRTTLVFGLPGNPVSSFACFHLFVRPAIDRLAGGSGDDVLQFEKGHIAASRRSANRTTYFPADLEPSAAGGPPVVRLLNWQGSADLRTVANASCLAELPVDCELEAGQSIRFLRLS